MRKEILLLLLIFIVFLGSSCISKMKWNKFVKELEVVSEVDNNLRIVKHEDRYGVLNKKREVIIPIDKDYIFWDNEINLFTVSTNDSLFYINRHNNVRIPFSYGLNFSEGISVLSKHRKQGYIDTSGNIIVKPIFSKASRFSCGRAKIRHKDGNFINKKGDILNLGKYRYIGDFSEGLIAVRKNDKWGFIDTSGNLVIPIIYEMAFSFKEGLAPVRLNKKWNYIDKEGNTVIETNYHYAFNFKNGFAPVQKGGWGIIDKSGNVVIPISYQFVLHEYDDLFCVKKNDKYGFVNAKNETIIGFEYDKVGNKFHEGLACVQKGDYYGYINKTGETVIPFIYKEAAPFKNGVAKVKKDGKQGYINKKGEIVIPLEYKYISNFKSGVTRVEKDYKGFYINIENKCVANCN